MESDVMSPCADLTAGPILFWPAMMTFAVAIEDTPCKQNPPIMAGLNSLLMG